MSVWRFHGKGEEVSMYCVSAWVENAWIFPKFDDVVCLVQPKKNCCYCAEPCQRYAVVFTVELLLRCIAYGLHLWSDADMLPGCKS